MLQKQFKIHFKVEEYFIKHLIFVLMMIYKTNKLFIKNINMQTSMEHGAI